MRPPMMLSQDDLASLQVSAVSHTPFCHNVHLADEVLSLISEPQAVTGSACQRNLHESYHSQQE